MTSRDQDSRRPSISRDDLLWDLIDHLDAMVAYWDRDQTCVFANSAYRAWFGKDGRELAGVKLRDLLGPLYERNKPYIDAAYAGQRQVFERSIPSPDGQQVRRSLATYIPRIVDGQVTGMFVHVADVEPLKKLEDDLRAAHAKSEMLATHDHLTGLPNRALLEDRMSHALAQAKRRNEGFALLCVDVDNFKSINDTFGHPEGDRYLIEIAARLTSSVREGDSVLRLGGDEFIAIAIDIQSIEDAETLAGRIVAGVRGTYAVGHSTVTPSVSVGVAIYPQHGTTAAALTEAADKALYTAKRTGRGRFALVA